MLRVVGSVENQGLLLGRVALDRADSGQVLGFQLANVVLTQAGGNVGLGHGDNLFGHNLLPFLDDNGLIQELIERHSVGVSRLRFPLDDEALREL